MLLPLNSIEEKVVELIPDKDTKLFVYCRSGNRSKTASELLIKLGYTNVYDMGGINDWPYETE
jgi:rhodanese-related sulfurtransferase